MFCWAVAAGAAAGALWAVGAAGAAAGDGARRSAPAIVWGPCSSSQLPAGAQCGLLSVPLDYGNPGGQQIQLALARVRHTSSHYQGAILVNPGGPGGSGLALGGFLATALQQEGFGAAAAAYDWIGFDPRGVGSSRPAISCIPNYFAADRQSYVPRTPRILSYWLSRSRAYARACESANPLQAELLRHMTTPDLARDMDSIRQALGQSQISYYGFSYGTYLGQVYATLFPTHLRRLILDSNINPRRIPFQTGNLDQDPAFNRDLNIWFAWLARYDRVYRLGTTERAVRKLFYATESRLRGHSAGGIVGPDEWVDGFIAAGYGQQAWPHLGSVFADWVHRPGVHSAGELIAIYRSADTPGNDNSFAVYLSIECTDAPWPTAWSTWARDVSAVGAPAPPLAWSNAWFNAPCIYWQAPAQAPVRVNGSGVSGALLIDETLDAPTPFQGSLVVRSLFPHSVLLAEPGGTSHAASLTGNLCVDRTIARYLTTGALPARNAHARWDKTCAPLPRPTPSGWAHSAQAGRVIVRRPGRFWVPALLAG